ncbi:Acetyltransferase (GNAT) family protein [Virgibacillus subterraneus]|uniref:Acetyltransferase (GNAT) family protein n=1 Tax=Virgibacillus subterraneus TaxID=621109 RepID=A0A1H8ZDX5_9BACI|nr:GNAT family N-acetyltransferase [Virgibacillus subterraneus]SEP62614.1 Acetyltransferase (GNAT) family protein [Virgibacillus subterraneus]
MKIDFLLNHPDKIKEVAEMIYKEFVVKASNGMKFEDVVKHFSNTGDNTFPITLLALENGECLGTVSIFENDLKIRDMYKPWLASLYTKPDSRSRGIGQKLVAKTIDVVKELGFKELYLRTEDTSEYYRNRGWAYVETVSDDNHEKIDIFKMKCI